MPLPPPLRPLVRTRRFWTDFLWETDADWGDDDQEPYPELEDCTVHLPVGGGYALSLSLDEALCYFSLGLHAPGSEVVEIGFDDQAHWHPHVLRWEELELVCRAAALGDPEFAHPGPLLLLLHRFAPICVGDDLDLIVPMLETAWKQLGAFSDSEIAGFIERADARDAGFHWRHDEATDRWFLEQEDEDRAAKALYTLRHPENDEFPFADLAKLLTEAAKTLSTAKGAGAEIARSFAETGELALGPKLAAQLRSEHEVSGLARVLGEAPDAARLGWLSEVILGLAPGEVIRRHLSRSTPEPREKHSLMLDLPLLDKVRPLADPAGKLMRDTLNRVLSDRDLGSADSSGAMSTVAEDGTRVTSNVSLSVLIKGDLDAGVDLVREALWWIRAPETVRLSRMFKDTIPLDLAKEPAEPRSRCLELSKIESVFLQFSNGYRFDRPPLPTTCREALRAVLTSAAAEGPDANGWFSITVPDGGAVRVCLRRVDEDQDLSGATIDLNKITPGVADLVWRLADEGQLLLLPMMLATSRAAAEMVEGSWPPVGVVGDSNELFGVLSRGPYAWWSDPN